MRQNPIERSTAIDLLKILDSEHFKQRTTFIRSKETNITKSIKIIDSNKAICEIVQKENKFNSKLYFTKNKKLYRSVSEIVSCTDDNEIRLWDITHEVCIATLDAHKNYIWCLEYLEITGEIISGSSDNKIKV
jgi:WD40 repeat protein